MALFDFTKVKQTISALVSELKALRAEREALLQKREELEGQPACKSDLLQLLDDWVDRKGEDFPRKLENGVSYYFRHPLLNLPESAKAPAHPMALLTAVADPNGMATLASFEASLFYLLGDAIKRGVREAVEQMDFTGHVSAPLLGEGFYNRRGQVKGHLTLADPPTVDRGRARRGGRVEAETAPHRWRRGDDVGDLDQVERRL